MKLTHSILSTLLLALVPCAFVAQDTPQVKAPGAVVGAAAQPFRLNDHNGKIAAVGGAAERWSILAFFPKAATPG
ncbi:MAG: hypothetical protein R3F49_16300 [Planctomycetota bacterium]